MLSLSDEIECKKQCVVAIWELIRKGTFVHVQTRLHPLKRLAFQWSRYNIGFNVFLSIQGQRSTWNHNQKLHTLEQYWSLPGRGIRNSISSVLNIEHEQIWAHTDVKPWFFGTPKDHKIHRGVPQRLEALLTTLHRAVHSSPYVTSSSPCVYIRCWREAPKSMKDTSQFKQNCNSVPCVAAHTFFFSSILRVRELDMDMYLSVPSLPFFMSWHSSHLSTIELNILYFVEVDGTHSICSVLCPRGCRGSHVSLAKRLGEWRNSFALSSNSMAHSGSSTLYSSLLPYVKQNMHIHNHCAVSNGSHLHAHSFHDERQLLPALRQSTITHCNSCMYQGSWSFEMTAAQWKCLI